MIKLSVCKIFSQNRHTRLVSRKLHRRQTDDKQPSFHKTRVALSTMINGHLLQKFNIDYLTQIV